MATISGIATKTASVLGLASIAIEAHDLGKRHSRNCGARASADKFVRDEIGASKLNYPSAKHAASKKFFANCDFTDKLFEIGGRVGGYFLGIGECIKNNIFTVAFSAMGLIAKTKPTKIIALIGMAASLIFDTVLNGTSIFEKKDYLDK